MKTSKHPQNPLKHKLHILLYKPAILLHNLEKSNLSLPVHWINPRPHNSTSPSSLSTQDKQHKANKITRTVSGCVNCSGVGWQVSPNSPYVGESATHMLIPCQCHSLSSGGRTSSSCPQLSQRSCSVPANVTASTQRVLQGQHLPPGLGKTPELHLRSQNSPKAGNWGLCYFLISFAISFHFPSACCRSSGWILGTCETYSHLFSFRQYSPSEELSWAINWHKILSITGSI